MDPFTGKPAFQGSLTLGGVLQGQGQGNKKKEAKQKAYDVAYQRFVTLDVAEIMKGVEHQVCV
jgi:dsRNA-specific ribonuclease